MYEWLFHVWAEHLTVHVIQELLLHVATILKEAPFAIVSIELWTVTVNNSVVGGGSCWRKGILKHSCISLFLSCEVVVGSWSGLWLLQQGRTSNLMHYMRSWLAFNVAELFHRLILLRRWKRGWVIGSFRSFIITSSWSICRVQHISIIGGTDSIFE